MISQRQLFLNHLAQTSDNPLLLEVEKASGVRLYGPDGREWIDLISGISVSNVGHCHPEVVQAVTRQAQKHMHLMVYGEVIQAPQVKLASGLAKILGHKLNNCYLVNSGSEAIEGSMKLARRHTGRFELSCMNHAYHGSTMGALSLMGSEEFRNRFRPLIPGISRLQFNSFDDLNRITEKTAAVFVEPIQGEAGVILPEKGYLMALRDRCNSTGALLVFDEIQTGFRRTGHMMAFMDEGVVPDILVLAKGMGGGMPIGAFITSSEIMKSLSHDPVLGHITTFGGHPVSAAAALAALEIVESLNQNDILSKEKLFREKLVHEKVINISGRGLMLSVEFESPVINQKIISGCIKRGLLTDWFLFAPNKLRIAPPLIIDNHDIFMSCEIILESIEECYRSIKF
jgi:acetylornithine/succinyldiaminopimelate/putrescine aminotransferase